MTPAALKSSRKSLGLSAARLAAMTGVTVSAIRKWESGDRPIPEWLALLIGLMQMPAVQRRLKIEKSRCLS